MGDSVQAILDMMGLSTPLQYLTVAMTIWWEALKNSWLPPAAPGSIVKPQDGVAPVAPGGVTTAPQNATPIAVPQELKVPKDTRWPFWLSNILRGSTNVSTNASSPGNTPVIVVNPVNFTDSGNVTKRTPETWGEWLKKTFPSAKNLTEKMPDPDAEDITVEEIKDAVKDVKANLTNWMDDFWKGLTGKPEPVAVPATNKTAAGDQTEPPKPNNGTRVPAITEQPGSKTNPLVWLNPLTWLTFIWGLSVASFFFVMIPIASFFSSLWSPIPVLFINLWNPFSNLLWNLWTPSAESTRFLWAPIGSFFSTSWHWLVAIPQLTQWGILAIFGSVWNFWARVFNFTLKPFNLLWYINIAIPDELKYWVQETLKQIGWQFGYLTTMFTAWLARLALSPLSKAVFGALTWISQTWFWFGVTWFWRNVVDWFLWQWVINTVLFTVLIAFTIPISVSGTSSNE